MVDEIKSNLEAIEDDDLSLKNKFKSKVEFLGKDGEVQKNPILNVGEKVERREGIVEKDSAYSKILAQVPKSVQAVKNDEVVNDAKNVSIEIDAKGKIEKLVVLAQEKGLPHAVSVARHMEDNYTLDEFHDRLIGDELHLALIEKGIIKKL
jgi:hypothetical protein